MFKSNRVSVYAINIPPNIVLHVAKFYVSIVN